MEVKFVLPPDIENLPDQVANLETSIQEQFKVVDKLLRDKKDPEQLMTVAQAAKLLAVSPDYFRKHFIRTGRLCTYEIGKGLKVKRRDLIALMDSVRFCPGRNKE